MTMSLERPIVSAVIPTRNRPELVVRAVRSALQQTFQDLEVVVVVDGPDQATVQALEEMCDPRVQVVALDKSVGGAEARNTGVRAARGEWIALLDDDDEWLANKIAQQLASGSSLNSSKALVVSSFLERAPGREDVIRPRRLPRDNELICEYMFDFLCYFQTSTFFCTRTLLLEIPFRKELVGFHDIDWFLRVNSSPDVRLAIIAEPVSIYHAPEQRATITSGLNWKERLAWGKRNRRLMTRRAYSRFLAGSCAGPAVRQKAGTRGLLSLLWESSVRGRLISFDTALLVGTFAITPNMRRALRDRWFLHAPKSVPVTGSFSS
jgi:glycosyltransferase involved in cell wall biosynthesis